MKWYIFLLLYTTPAELNITLPKLTQPDVSVDLGYRTFSGSNTSQTVSINSLSVKDVSCTAIEVDIAINQKNRFIFTTNILYIKIIDKWELHF